MQVERIAQALVALGRAEALSWVAQTLRERKTARCIAELLEKRAARERAMVENVARELKEERNEEQS